MASSSSSHPFSGIETPRVRRKASESSRVFDVFINHRGPDVKETLARQLYNSLKDIEIWAFLDSEEIQHGHSFPSAIENAINSASVHIAIFFKGYAESPWCFEELLLMLQSRAQIIPVFYEVNPSSLRYIEKGEYGKAFTEYVRKKRYTEKLEEWKEALQTVSFIRGYEIDNLNVSDCQKIVSAVQEEVKRRKRLYVAKHPVGLQKLVKDFERRCLDELVQDIQRQCGVDEGGKGKAQIVGIFGMGGVGKTTLAKELFNRKQSQHTRACFLFDVREAYSNNTFPSLQMKLVKDLFQRDELKFHCTEEGTNYIGECIERSKQLSFLIVVDDIDHVQQLDALLIMDMLKKSADSLIIITTRDVGVLINTGITAGYNLKGMDREDARELFCWHAFDQPHPANDYQNLVESFLRVCGGLPLSLQVIGRHVHGRDQSYWSSELNKVNKILPRDVHRSLKISFDALDYEEKQIFLDIACFFVDKSKSIAMSVWEASGWSAQSALEALKNKCLAEDISGWGLRMHDHLRDMGREIASELCHPRRLWRPRDLEYLESMGFRNIIAQTKGRCFHSIFDKSMTSQITYFLGESDVSADTSTSLLRLELEGVSNYRSIPSWIPLQNLRCLVIRNSDLKTLWQDHVEQSIPSCIPLQNLGCSIISKLRLNTLRQSDVQAPTQLKELEIYDTSLETISDLSGISNSLNFFLIKDCIYLKTVSVSDLKKLTELNISGCSRLLELSVVHLSCLKKLILRVCNSLKTVSGLDLRKLVELNISMCPVSVQLHLAGLNTLKCIMVDYYFKPKFLKLDGCRNLKNISQNLNLENLVKINIRDCPKLEVLPSLQGLSNLVTVTIDGCGKLNSLFLSECQNLERVTLGLTCPKMVNIDGCGRLNCLQLFKSQNLKKVSISNCLKLEELPCFACQTCLEKISIVRCGKLQNITLPTKLLELEIEECRELKKVAAICNHSECLELNELSSVPGLSCLKRIRIQACDKLQTIQGIDEFHALESLQLLNCLELEELPYSALPTSLKKIIIVRCGKLQNITLPTKLVELGIEECRELNKVAVICNHSEHLELQELSSVAQPSCLKRITIQNCDKLQTLQGIDELHALESLQLFNCPELEELPCFARQTCLEKISIVRCGKLQNITLPTKLVELGIEECRELKKVAVICDHSEHQELQELSSVARPSCLKRITIQTCDKLQTLQGIDELHALESLQLFNCPELKELPCSALQTNLENISIHRCGKMENITLPTKVVELRIEECREVKKITAICNHSECLELNVLSSVARLSCLKRITIQTCDKLQTLQGIDELHELESLQFLNCLELEELPYSALPTSLEKISIVRCGKLQNITLPTKLVELGIVECRELKKVAVICDHSEHLELQELSSVAQPSCLKRITIQTCDKLQTVQGIDELHVLESLQLFNCPELEELPCFSRQTCLKSISIVRCGKLQNITLPTKLVVLRIQECRELKKVAAICNHSKCLELNELSSDARLSCLKRITIQTCDKLKTIQGMDELHALESLQLFNCPELKELPYSALPTSLKKIIIVRCGKLQNITLPTKLVELRIEECRELKKVAAICNHSECLERNELSSLARLSCLKRITIQTCEKLQTLQGIDELHELERMQITNCSNAAIRNCISMLKSVPPEFLVVIGRAVDGAQSTLKPDLFSDADLIFPVHSEFGARTRSQGPIILPEWSAVIFCCGVVVNSSTEAQLINDIFASPNLEQGEYIITIVTTSQYRVWEYDNFVDQVWEYDNFVDQVWECDNFVGFLVNWGMTKKAYRVGVKKGEEWKTELHRIIDRLHVNRNAY